MLHRIGVPLIEPFRISNGVVAEKEAILIELATADSVVGWGEASPMGGSFYSSATPESSWAALRDLILPAVFSHGAFDPRRFWEFLREQAGDAFSKAGIEGAMWDAWAKTREIALCDLLEIERRPVSSGVAIGIFETIDELLERVRRYVGEGYQRVKIKIQPGWDIKPVESVRAEFPQLPLMVDANAAYSIDDLEIFRELDRFDLMMIEQPLAADAFVEAGALQKQLRTPLCADESAESLSDLERIIEHRAAKIINIKVQRVGGISEALLMLERARAAELRCWVGTMPELGIASAQGLHLAMHPGFSFPTDIEASERWYVDDLVEPLIEIDKRGFIEVPVGPGNGFVVARERLERYTIATERFA